MALTIDIITKRQWGLFPPILRLIASGGDCRMDKTGQLIAMQEKIQTGSWPFVSSTLRTRSASSFN